MLRGRVGPDRAASRLPARRAKAMSADDQIAGRPARRVRIPRAVERNAPSRCQRPLTDCATRVPIPDRWRLVVDARRRRALVGSVQPEQRLKGDRPVCGDDWFFNLSASRTRVSSRATLPTPVGGSRDRSAGQHRHRSAQRPARSLADLASSRLVYTRATRSSGRPTTSSASCRCSTSTASSSTSSARVNIDPARRHAPQRRATSASRSVRRQAPAQRVRPLRLRQRARRHPAVHDRLPRLPVPGQPLGVRLFGTRDNNRWQYNLGVVPAPREGHQQRLERRQPARCATTTSSSPTSTARTCRCRASRSQGTVVYNRNREGDEQSTSTTNGFLERPAIVRREQRRTTTT